MSRKAILLAAAAVLSVSAAVVLAQYGGASGPPAAPSGGGSAGRGGTPDDVAISGSYFYVLQGDFLHQLRLGQTPSVISSVSLPDVIRSAQERGALPPGRLSFSGKARVTVPTGHRVYVMIGQNLFIFTPRLQLRDVYPFGLAIDRAMQEIMRERERERGGPPRR